MIELLGGYCIKSDRKQFIMGQTRKDKAGHTRFKEPHYFSTMQGAVKEAIRRLLCEKVAGDEITTLRPVSYTHLCMVIIGIIALFQSKKK